VEPALVVIGLNHRTAPIEVRERFWMSPARQDEALTTLAQSEGIEEAFVFSTCNRTEFVVWGDPTLTENSVLRLLSAQYDLRLCEWGNFYRLLDEQAVAHAFRVSCGLDSMSLGEGQIGREVNAAWQRAKTAGCTGPYLDALLRKALAVRRIVRRQTTTGFNLQSASQAAIEVAGTIFGSFARLTVVVLGAGSVGRTAAQALCDRGVESAFILSRTDERSDALSRRLGIRMAPFAERYSLLGSADLVISATGAGEFILTAEGMERSTATRAGRKQVIMDLALPRDVDPRVGQITGILLYNLDDLERSLQPRAGASAAESEAERIVLAEVQQFGKDIAVDEKNSEIADLQHRLDEICRQELESIRQEHGPFPKDQDQIIMAVSSRITHRIAGSLARQLRTRP